MPTKSGDLYLYLYLLQDPDFRELRDTRDWMDLLAEVRGGLSRETKINLRAEAKVRGSSSSHK
jgi:hypothetical protein